MNDALTLGPFVLPHALLLLLAAVLVAIQVGKFGGRKADPEVDVEPALWFALLAVAIIARLAFVWQYRSAYFDSPLGIVDIRDGGWSPLAGIVGGWLFVLWHGTIRPALRKPLRRAMLAGTAVWLVGSAAFVMLPQAAQRLPALELSTLDGGAVRLDSFVGRPTVVNLWATWCPPCIREMPLLLQAQQGNPGVDFVFLNQGEPAGKVASWLEQRALPLQNVLIDPQLEAAKALGSKAYPTTLFFDSQGRLVASRVGELSRATLSEKLQLIQR